MDIDLLKSSPEDQLEMMMMMQLDKLPDFSGHAYNDDVSGVPSMEFTQAQLMESSHVSSSASAFMNLPSTISFTDSPVEPSALPHFLSNSNPFSSPSQKRTSMAAMREMIFRIAAMQPIHIDPESVKPPKRRNVKISKDPQSVAARHRRERISERIRILQRLVPGGTKMDTASMLDEAIHYVKFLKNQVQLLEKAAVNRPAGAMGFPVPMSSGSFNPMVTKGYQSAQTVQQYLDA
ncbi:hypothetical protein RJ640_020231 [Escallonia rubra]|uniref:BHLH domain-containing protein n=1 Tax=Escallonia rubra TaxID=112253 RepID=A0AA88URJ9_9ASTE|nr:hypothetical protein RJ640_020230 [Escallonia rubra]KAK2995595.1 hypothetical protein RJ640_020231 [Escallonia rubra]